MVMVSAAVVVKMRPGVGSATGWWRPRVMGKKGERGRQIKQDTSRRFRDPWVARRVGVASKINFTRPLPGRNKAAVIATRHGDDGRRLSTSWSRSVNDRRDQKYGARPGWDR